MTHNDDLLKAALIGYQSQLDNINAKIDEVRRSVYKNGHSTKTSVPKKHKISAEVRARIAAAQRKRWRAAKKSASDA